MLKLCAAGEIRTGREQRAVPPTQGEKSEQRSGISTQHGQFGASEDSSLAGMWIPFWSWIMAD